MISLFSEKTGAKPAAFLLRGFHSCPWRGVAPLSFGIIYTPEFNDPVVSKRYMVRHLDLRTPKNARASASFKGIVFPGPHEAVVHKTHRGLTLLLHAVMRLTADAERAHKRSCSPIFPIPSTEGRNARPTVTIWTPKELL